MGRPPPPHPPGPVAVHLTDQWDESEDHGGRGGLPTEGNLLGSGTGSTISMDTGSYLMADGDYIHRAEPEPEPVAVVSSGQKLVRKSSRLAVSSNAWDSEGGTVEWDPQGQRQR